jgi:hypothetical protein
MPLKKFQKISKKYLTLFEVGAKIDSTKEKHLPTGDTQKGESQ